MTTELAERCKNVLVGLGLCNAQDVVSVEPLTGGVASDIAAVSIGAKTICVKFALGKLKVEADWFAPVHRSRAEFSWLSVAGNTVPASVPKLYGWSEAENGFAMEFISGPDVYLWKTHLLEGSGDNGEAIKVADTIGQIHAASTTVGFETGPFENASDFEQIRIEPYLRATAKVHSDLAPQLLKLADGLASANIALVHGDISPKNIIIRNGHPVMLDAECATMGDPAFDIAFCLNHLFLKALHLPRSSKWMHQAITEFWSAYKPYIKWENQEDMEARVAALLPALMLARVDGKSPVEYLSAETRDQVRSLARPYIERPVSTVAELNSAIASGAHT